MEDKAVAEAIKVLRQAATDKIPEVRSVAATLAGRMAPLLVPNPPRPTTGGSVVDPLLALEEVVQFALKNLDDESPATAETWADALARCICTAIYHHQQQKAQQQQQGDREGGGPGDTIEEADHGGARPSPRFAAVRRQQPGTPRSSLAFYRYQQGREAAGIPVTLRPCNFSMPSTTFLCHVRLHCPLFLSRCSLMSSVLG